jgi:GNAT superfamily N-acetyltransferase
MDLVDNLILLPAKWQDYKRFQSLCCVDTVPAVVGPCWIMALQAADESCLIEPEVAFVGYSYAFRDNAIRRIALPLIPKMSRRRAMSYLNRNIRCLTRVMVKPLYRGRGIASCIIQQTLPLVGVPFIECLTFTEGIASILLKCGFVNHGRQLTGKCDYFLFKQ